MKKIFIFILIIFSLIFSQTAERIYDAIEDANYSEANVVIPEIGIGTNFNIVIVASNKNVLCKPIINVGGLCDIKFYYNVISSNESLTNSHTVYNGWLGYKDYTQIYLYTLAVVTNMGSLSYSGTATGEIIPFRNTVFLSKTKQYVLSISNVSGSTINNANVKFELIKN